MIFLIISFITIWRYYGGFGVIMALIIDNYFLLQNYNSNFGQTSASSDI